MIQCCCEADPKNKVPKQYHRASITLCSPLNIQSLPKRKTQKTKFQSRVTFRLTGTKFFRNAAARMKWGFLEVPFTLCPCESPTASVRRLNQPQVSFPHKIISYPHKLNYVQILRAQLRINPQPFKIRFMKITAQGVAQCLAPLPECSSNHFGK